MAVYSRTGGTGSRRVRSVVKKRNGEGKLVKTVYWTEVSKGNPKYKYYDINGKSVSREYLWEKGYEDILR